MANFFKRLRKHIQGKNPIPPPVNVPSHVINHVLEVDGEEIVRRIKNKLESYKGVKFYSTSFDKFKLKYGPWFKHCNSMSQVSRDCPQLWGAHLAYETKRIESLEFLLKKVENCIAEDGKILKITCSTYINVFNRINND